MFQVFAYLSVATSWRVTDIASLLLVILKQNISNGSASVINPHIYSSALVSAIYATEISPVTYLIKTTSNLVELF